MEIINFESVFIIHKLFEYGVLMIGNEGVIVGDSEMFR